MRAGWSLALVGCLAAAAALAQPAEVPDDSLTPGAIASTDEAEVCGIVGGLTYSQRHRVWRGRRATLAKYGYPAATPLAQVEDDDRVPVCLGGDNADPRNHWAMPAPAYHRKDLAEAEACRRVCRQHAMTLAEAQALFLAPADWHDAYRALFGREP